jgi:tricorn protease
MATRPHYFILAASATVSTALLTTAAVAVDTLDTRLLATPAITEGKIAFAYGDDIWVANSDGTSPRRLTSHPGEEKNPVFSPDGKHIAFTGIYDGNDDVYVIPTAGGAPTRLTWHPGPDLVRGFAPDGKVLFTSPRAVFSRRHTQLFKVDISGGVPERLPVPTADKGAVSPDGKYLAYTPLGEVFHQWKNYRGGTASRIWILRLDDLSHEEIPKPVEGCNDTEPMWIGETVYFLSDRDGEFNLYSYDRNSKKVNRCTGHDAFPITSASTGAGQVIYEQAGWIFLFDPREGKPHRLQIGVAADLTEPRPRYATGVKHIRSVDVSPTGKRVVLEYRGEIVTAPVKKGDPRNITQTPSAHERSPIWSPDGKSIAYLSDASGEYTLVVRPQDGKAEGRSYPLQGAGFYERPVWAPDSQKIALIDNARTLRWIDLATGTVKRIAAEPIYGPSRASRTSFAWSPDSKWLAYAISNRIGFQSIWLHAVESGRSYSLSDGLVEASEPIFDGSGKYLFFVASTDAGPVNNWFDQSFTDMRKTASIYLVTLARATANPLLKESDEEGTRDPDKDKDAGKHKKDEVKGQQSQNRSEHEKEKKKPATAIDLEGITERIIPLPIDVGNIQSLAAGSDGQIYYLRHRDAGSGRTLAMRSSASLKRFDLKTRQEEALAEGISEFKLSADRKKILYTVTESESEAGPPLFSPVKTQLGVVDAGKFAKGDGALKLEAISVRVEPRVEWPQILREAWRINRDYFYAPNMHGADWNAVWKKYAEFLPHVATRGDLSRIIRMMLSELAVGHSRSEGGERLHEPKPMPIGLLGADYETAAGRYRFQKIYGGAFWDPSLRAPLVAPDVHVEPGEFLLAVDNKEIKTDSEIYRFFEGTVGKRVELRVGPAADGSGARTVIVEPIANESGLRNRAWVESNLHKVHEQTKGRAGYVYVPNTGEMGYNYFKRYFFPQADKEAIIVDERFNGGGQVADYYIELLRRPLVSYWATRYGDPIRTPNAAVLGPKVMIIDETAGSGGDLLPWMFRKFSVGKLVGRRTWGGLVGTLGFPILMDGGAVTAPDLAIFTEEGWIVENVGVPPDIEVEQDPVAVAAGKDPQLDRAISVVLSELAANPSPRSPARPPFPIRIRPSACVGPSSATALQRTPTPHEPKPGAAVTRVR